MKKKFVGLKVTALSIAILSSSLCGCTSDTESSIEHITTTEITEVVTTETVKSAYDGWSYYEENALSKIRSLRDICKYKDTMFDPDSMKIRSASYGNLYDSKGKLQANYVLYVYFTATTKMGGISGGEYFYVSGKWLAADSVKKINTYYPSSSLDVDKLNEALQEN